MTETTALDLTDHAAALDHRRENARVADEAARMGVFATYRSTKAANTLRRQDTELAHFGEYVQGENLSTDAEGWAGLTWGLVDGFVKYLLSQGFAIGTINNHLSTVKSYAKLATKAGTLAREQYAMMKLVEGFDHSDGVKVDAKREEAGWGTRRGYKKSTFRVLSRAQAAAMRANCGDTPQGRRDRLILTLLLDLGMRVSEAAALQVAHFDPESRELVTYRAKTDTSTTFELRNGKLSAMLAYLAVAHTDGQLLQGSLRDGTLAGGMSTRAIYERVARMGAAVGVDDLGCHDLRHTSATWQAKAGAPITELKEKHGWKSAETAVGYVEASRVVVID